MNETMSDEELSELAECLEDACRDPHLPIRRLAQFTQDGRGYASCCPFGALIEDSYPWAHEIVAATGVPERVALGFMAGFDGVTFSKMPPYDSRAYELGKQFRARYA